MLALLRCSRQGFMMGRTEGGPMTQSLMAQDRNLARKKGWIALGAWVGSGFLVFYHFRFFGVAAAAGAVWLTYRWFMFRAKRGMRF
jgi:hypothetical protein